MNDNLDIHISKWISWIQNEKRLSSHTVISYNSDLKSFFYFLKSHLNKEIKYELLSKIDEDDLLGWFYNRLKNGTSHRSNARALSSLKSFITFLIKKKLSKAQKFYKLKALSFFNLFQDPCLKGK